MLTDAGKLRGYRRPKRFGVDLSNSSQSNVVSQGQSGLSVSEAIVAQVRELESAEPITLCSVLGRHALCDIAQGLSSERMALFGYAGSINTLFVDAKATRSPALGIKPKRVFDYLRFARNTKRSETKQDFSESNLVCDIAEGPVAVRLCHPVMTYEEMDAVKGFGTGTRRTMVLDTTMGLETSLKQRLLQIAFDAKTAVEEGFTFLVLSDRKTSDVRLHVPAVLACGAVHRLLSLQKLRAGIGLFVETGETRGIHDFGCLYACGADGVHPFLAQECIVDEVAGGQVPESAESLVIRYREALESGLKTLLSRKRYGSLEAFKRFRKLEAHGLATELVELCLPEAAAKSPSDGFQEVKAALLAQRAKN